MKLEAKQISYQYSSKDRKIFDQFSFAIENHERVGFIGSSGFGKTTLCKIMAGYLEPDAGEVLLDGSPLSGCQPYCPVQMIWQHPEHSVNPRLRMKAVLEEGDDIEPRVIQGLGIEADWYNRYPAELSGGELQRFCIARALGRRTRFLIADEISTMLDVITRSQIWNFLLKEVEIRNIGLLVISHSEPLLDYICTRKVYLE